MGQAFPTGVAGGCLCGAVRFTAAPKNKEFDVCHCNMCRRWCAGPFLALECGAKVQIEDRSNLGIYRSSEWAERGFCKVCGTPLFYRLVDSDSYAVSVEAFDDRSGLSMHSQIFIDEKPDYYDFANKTKMMTGAEAFAAFAPPDAGQAKG
jgi:hypothetical protein